LVKVDDYEIVDGLYYSKEFFWVRIENGKARMGITDYAQKQLREIVFAELPSGTWQPRRRIEDTHGLQRVC